MDEIIFIKHLPNELPPVAKDEISRTFGLSDSYFAKIDNEHCVGESFLSVVHYSHRSRVWRDLSGEDVYVLEWYSRKENSNA